MDKSVEKRYNTWIIILSVIIPIVVVILFGVKIPNVEPLSFLPPIYASINGLTAVLLIAAVIAIKKGNRKLHENIMKVCILCSVLFLGMYVAYHMTSNSTSYGGEGILKTIYFVILISHIVLSVVIIPIVLVTYVRALLGKYDLHKKIARYAFPLWLYVAVTGVVVYLMISPYYVY